jgi:hypothetical protein
MIHNTCVGWPVYCGHKNYPIAQLNFNKQKLDATLRRPCNHLESEPIPHVQAHPTATHTRSNTYRPVISNQLIAFYRNRSRRNRVTKKSLVNTTEVFHRSGNSELTKTWVSTGRTRGKSNFTNDKGINTSGIRPDGNNSVIDLTLTYRGKREFTSSIQQRSRQKIIVQSLNIYRNLVYQEH